MNVEQWLRHATGALQTAGSPTARLDAQILLADELQYDKSQLLAYPEHNLSSSQQAQLAQKLARRIQREPMAYIREKQAFYGRDFTVSPEVLIPRPETETLIDELGNLSLTTGSKILDVGTGSGAIAITARLEQPELSVYASDISNDALKVARANARLHHAQVDFARHNLLDGEARGPFAAIIANLPYVDRTWLRSPETNHEPATALFADDHGLALIKQLIKQAPQQLLTKGYLLLEADPRQHTAIIEYAHVYRVTQQRGYILVLQRLH